MTSTPHTIVAFIDPQPPRYHHTDPDGDRLLITTADIPGVGPGIYFKTDEQGSGVPLAELDALIASLHEIADAVRPAVTEETV
ncbi:hypothetical protein ACWCWD_06485 [Streptomyces sp. NPDC001493]